jgi:Flp pilus assembly protein protease CpaA
VLPTFFVVVLTGGALGVVTMLRTGSVRSTLQNILMLLLGLLPGWKLPRLAIPTDRRKTIPYGVAITFGSLISLFIFRT